MKNLVWFCLGVITGPALKWLSHAFYVAAIIFLLFNHGPLFTIDMAQKCESSATYKKPGYK